MKYAILAFLFFLVSASACAQEEKRPPTGRLENDVVSTDPNVVVMRSQRSVICIKDSVIEKVLNARHQERRVFSAATHENGAQGFALFVGPNGWTAVEYIKGRGCIIQSGKVWAGTIKVPGSAL